MPLNPALSITKNIQITFLILFLLLHDRICSDNHNIKYVK